MSVQARTEVRICMGKGSAPRPIPNYEQYASNWDLIFNKNKEVTQTGQGESHPTVSDEYGHSKTEKTTA